MPSPAPLRGARRCAPVLVALAAAAGCGDAVPTEPVPLALDAVDADAALAPRTFVGRDGRVTLALRVGNAGSRAVGPVHLEGGVLTAAGGPAPGLVVALAPGEIPTLNPGDVRDAEAVLSWSGPAPVGDFRLAITAEAGGAEAASLTFDLRVAPPPDPRVGSIEIVLPAEPVQGEGYPSPVVVRDTLGAVLDDAGPHLSFSPGVGAWHRDGVGFVALSPGPLTVVARAGEAADTVEVVVRPRGRRVRLNPVAETRFTRRHTSDLWVRGGAAWTGSWGTRDAGDGPRHGDMLYSWRLESGGVPLLVDSLRLDARTVNDIKVHPTRPLGVATHEGSNDGLNGVTLLDLGDPHRPSPIARYSHGLESGVHNAWLDGDHLYLVLDGRGSGLRILDISDPSAPYTVASVFEGGSFLHDVLVRDGLAFLSQWNDGLVILDVGHGVAGGSPTHPVEVSRIVLDGETHNAWYWPARSLVVVGEEDFATPGRISFVDVSDLRRPRRVGVWEVPGATPHNVWLDEEAEVLWAAWYGNGIQGLDVSGTVLGDVRGSGRELVSLRYAGGDGGCAVPATCTWSPQLHDGLLYLSDLNHGLVVLRPEELR